MNNLLSCPTKKAAFIYPLCIMSDKTKDTPPIFLPGNVRLLRKMKRLSQQKLADQLGLKRNNIATYEAGIVEPNARNFLRMVRFFHVPAHHLLFTDLSTYPRFQLEQKEGRSEEKRKQDIELFQQLMQQSHEVQTALEGFKAFYKMQVEQEKKVGSDQQSSLKVDLSNTLSALEELLEANWNFVNAIQKDKKTNSSKDHQER
jgi:transcriptional regulator with XRE-family HTH domain